jgi:hypothetical protein
MSNKINLVFGLMCGLLFGVGMYFLSIIILCLPWPPPANVFHIQLSTALLHLRFIEAIKFGGVIGGAIGLLQGILSGASYDTTLTRTGIQCWFIVVITIFINHWGELSGAWLKRLLLLTPLTLFFSFLLIMIISGFWEALFKQKPRT